jgi:hypothetical protein
MASSDPVDRDAPQYGGLIELQAVGDTLCVTLRTLLSYRGNGPAAWNARNA